MALNFPNSPTIGDEFTGGGFTWTWTGDSWDKVMAATTGGAGFSLLVGSSGNTTYAFENPQPAGYYTLTSKLNDTTFDIYFVTPTNESAGYTNTFAVETSAEFDRVVVYGATADDIFNFEYKPSALPATSGDVADGAAPFLTSATPATLASIDDTTTVTGGNFASDVEIVFTGQDDVDRAAKNIVRSSSTSLIVTRPDSFPVEQEPYTMTATNAGIANPSTGVNVLTDYFDAGGVVTWITTSLPNFEAGEFYSATLEAVDEDGLSVGYSIVTGSLPAGISLNGQTGVLSGTAVGGEIEVTLTFRATDSGGNFTDKEFVIKETIIVAAETLIAAGGGGGGSRNGSGGGAGGILYGNLQLISRVDYSVSIGAGGGGGPSGASNYSANGSKGTNTIFSGFTCIGGGGGMSPTNNTSGGSPGGNSTTIANGRVAEVQQTSQAPLTAYANGMGDDGGFSGGGGAGGVSYKKDGTLGAVGRGGLPITLLGVTLGGGGGYTGGGSYGNWTPGPGGGGGAGNGTSFSTPGQDATANSASGGGGCGYNTQSTPKGGNGGSGRVVVKYPDLFNIESTGLTVTTTAPSGGFKTTTITAGTGTIRWTT
jgi:hypothetical protein